MMVLKLQIIICFMILMIIHVEPLYVEMYNFQL